MWDFCASTVTLHVSRASFANGHDTICFTARRHCDRRVILGAGLQSWTTPTDIIYTVPPGKIDVTSLNLWISSNLGTLSEADTLSVATSKHVARQKAQQPPPREPLWTLNRRTCHEESPPVYSSKSQKSNGFSMMKPPLCMVHCCLA